MIIEKVDPACECFDDFFLDGKILTIGGGVIINLEAEEDDQEKIITIGACKGMVHRGLKPCCTYVADVIIPPRKYETVETDGEHPGGETTTRIESIPVPLDTDSVTLRLWPVEKDQGEVNNQSNMEANNVA